MRSSTVLKLISGSMACLLFLAPAPNAITIHVPSDQPTIQAGIDAAVDGDTVLVAQGTYTGEGNRDINFRGKSIAVGGDSISGATVVDCQAAIEECHRGFLFVSGEDSMSILENITVTHAVSFGPPDSVRYGAGAFCRNSSPRFRKCNFEGNWAEYGGGVGIIENSYPVFQDCRFHGNVADRFGGGVCVSTFGSSIATRFVRCKFVDNSAGHAGGALAAGPLTISEYCVFYGNWGPDEGGACDLQGGDNRLYNCTFVKNYSSAFGDAICGWGRLSIGRCLIAFNRGGDAVHLQTDSLLEFECNDVFLNEGGDWVGEIASLFNQGGNFSADPVFCDTSSGNFTVSGSSPCASAQASCGVLIGALDVGCSSTDVDSSDPESLPSRIWLHQNYPNPFNPSTTIEFELVKPARAVVRVYNALGELVRTLVDRQLAVGTHRVVWDGRDDQGREVASGVYLYRLTAGGATEEKKMVLVR